MDTPIKFIIPGIVFLLTLASGVWLSHLGKPYNGFLFSVHKLIALGAVIVMTIQLARTLENADSLALIIALLALAGLCVVALFATGALMSMGKLNYAVMLTIHKIAPVVVVIAMALVVYLLG
ncbi:MAG: hypothetical protein JW934_05330 [Anaerolineae bacterium]|nr:hypothetical protein [Anaerolineae bacterium]